MDSAINKKGKHNRGRGDMQCLIAKYNKRHTFYKRAFSYGISRVFFFFFLQTSRMSNKLVDILLFDVARHSINGPKSPRFSFPTSFLSRVTAEKNFFSSF